MPSRAGSEQMPSRDYIFAGAACPKLGGDPAACESRSDELFPAPNPWSWSASGGNPNVRQGVSDGDEAEDIPQTLSDVTPDNYWVPGADYAAEHHEFPRAHYKRMPLENSEGI